MDENKKDKTLIVDIEKPDPLKDRVVCVYVKQFKKIKRNYLANYRQEKFLTYCSSKQAIRNFKIKEEKKKLEQAKAVVDKKKSKKGKVWNLIFFIVNILVITIILWVQADKGEVSSADKLKVNWWFLVAALAGVLGMMFCEQCCFTSLIHKATKVFRPNLAFKTGTVGKYYDLITPFASGGQPFQIYYLSKYGLKASQAVSVSIAKYIFKQIACVIFFGIVLLFNLSVSAKSSGAGEFTVGLASWIGYAVIFVILIFTALIANNKKIGSAIVIFGLKVGSKIKLVKNYKESFRKLMRGVNTWQSTMRSYRRSWFVIPFNILISAAELILQYTIPFFVFCAFEGYQPEMWFNIVTLAVMVDLAACFIPLPGGTGVAELSFTTLFFGLFTQGSMFWALIIWRFFSYYIFLLGGIILIFYDFLFGTRRLEKNKEKWSKPKIKIKFTL